MNERMSRNRISEATVVSLVLCLFISVVLVIGVLGIREMDGTTTTNVVANDSPSAATPTAEASNNAVIDAAAMPSANWNPRDPIIPSATSETSQIRCSNGRFAST